MISRSPLEFLRRNGIVKENARPRPRLDISALLVHTIPLASPPKPLQSVLETFEGSPPPDRGLSRSWPGQLTPADQTE